MHSDQSPLPLSQTLTFGKSWPSWCIELPGGQLGQELAILLVGDAAFGDKANGAMGVIREVIAYARRLNPDVRLRFLATPQAGTLLMALVTLPTWADLLDAAGPGSLSLDQVSDPLGAPPDLTLFLWDPRHRRPSLLQLAHEAAERGLPVRCFAYTGLRTVGPVDIPSIPTTWNGGQDGCSLGR